ncbi:MAG: hypothetical protein IKZ43_01815 [Acidaminococcaceae bacterium]|nr:hypothetical protein [Acidaminococcaceae bacterium]
MAQKIISLLCFLLMLTGMTALAKEKSMFPNAGVYFRTNDKGAINGNLTVFMLPDGKVFFEVFAMDYKGDESGLIPAMEKGGEPKAVFAGIMEHKKKKTLAHMDFGTNGIGDELEEWQYPVNADKTSKNQVRLSYELIIKGKEITLAPADTKYSTKQFFDKVEVAGRYVKAEDEFPDAGACLAAYAAERFDPDLARLALTRSNVARWKIDRLPAGDYDGISAMPMSLQVSAYNGAHTLLGTYLVAGDLSAVYKISGTNAKKLSAK